MVYESRAWNIVINDSDGDPKIKLKNRIRRVLEMHYEEHKPRSEIIDATGFDESTVSHILMREVTFVLGG